MSKENLRRVFNRVPTIFKEHFQDKADVESMDKWAYFSPYSFMVFGRSGSGKTNLIYHYLANASQTEELIVHVVSQWPREEYDFLTKAFNGRYGLYSDPNFLPSIFKEVEERQRAISHPMSLGEINALRIAVGEKPLPRIVVIFEELSEVEVPSNKEDILKEIGKRTWDWNRVGVQAIISDRGYNLWLKGLHHAFSPSFYRTILLGDTIQDKKAQIFFNLEKTGLVLPAPSKQEGVLLYIEKGEMAVYPHLLKIPNVDNQGFRKKVRGD